MIVRSENGKVIIKAEAVYVKRVEFDDGTVSFKVKAVGSSRRSPITLKSFDAEADALNYMDRFMLTMVG